MSDTKPSLPPVTGPGRYARLYAALWRNSVVREMGFKINFVLWIVVEFLWFVLQLAFMGVIYTKTDHIGDWTRWEVVFLVGTSHFIQQLFQTFFMSNCIQFPELIRTGRLDFMLLLPVNPRFLVSLRVVDLGGFVNASSALAVMIYALHQLHHVPSGGQIATFILLVLVGILIHYSLMFILATISFWTVRAQGIMWGYYSLFNVARMPDTAYQGWFRRVFTLVLPILLVTNVPARVACDKLQSPWDVGLLLLLAAVCYGASEVFWRLSLRRYTSASS